MVDGRNSSFWRTSKVMRRRAGRRFNYLIPKRKSEGIYHVSNKRLDGDRSAMLDLLNRIARKGEFMDMEGQRLVVYDWLARRGWLSPQNVQGDASAVETPVQLGSCSPSHPPTCSPSSYSGKTRVLLCQVVSKETGEILSRHIELRDAKKAAGARIDRGEPRPTVRTIYEYITKDLLASLYP